jgi:hypothetical protein
LKPAGRRESRVASPNDFATHNEGRQMILNPLTV